MGKLNRLKLAAISKSSLQDREMNKIYGGTYCAFGSDNQKANESAGTCSCFCANGYDAYSERSAWAKYDKALE